MRRRPSAVWLIVRRCLLVIQEWIVRKSRFRAWGTYNYEHTVNLGYNDYLSRGGWYRDLAVSLFVNRYTLCEPPRRHFRRGRSYCAGMLTLLDKQHYHTQHKLSAVLVSIFSIYKGYYRRGEGRDGPTSRRRLGMIASSLPAAVPLLSSPELACFLLTHFYEDITATEFGIFQ